MEDNTTVVIDIQLQESEVSKRLAQVNAEMAALRKTNADMKKEVKDGGKTWQEISVQLAANEAKLKSLKAEQSALSGQVAKATTSSRSYGDSLKEQAALLTDLKNQYQSLTKAEREGARGQELLKHIQELDEAVKQADYSQGNFQRNVGNYPGAIKPLQDSLDALTKKMEELQAAGKGGSDEFKDLAKQAEYVKASIDALSATAEGMGQESVSLKSQLRQLTEELMQMRAEGKQNTEEYNALLKKAGELKDAMQDARREIEQMASDTGALNAVLDAGKLAAGGFSVALGIMNLAGDKDSKTAKELAEAQRKLQAAIAITTGLQAVQNTLQKESALMMGVAKIRMLAATAAQRAYAAATNDAAAAQRVFNTVSKSNVYVWLAGLILTVVGAISAFTIGSRKQKEQLEQTNIELQNQAEILEQLNGHYREMSKGIEEEAEANIAAMKEQGAATADIRKAEDDLFNTRKKNFMLEQDRLQAEIANYSHVKDEYEKNIRYMNVLTERRLEFLKKGDTVRARIDQQEINRIQEIMKVQKAHIDLVDDFNSRYSAFLLEREKTLNERKREDEERAKAAREAAKAAFERWKTEVTAIREANKEIVEITESVKLADIAEREYNEGLEKTAEALETLHHRLNRANEELKLAREILQDTDLTAFADKLERQSNPLYAFSQSYKEYAESIMESNAAMESSFGALSSYYKAMAEDESRSEADRAKAAEAAKTWSRIQIAANAGAAVAKGTAAAVDVGFPAAIPAIMTMTAAIMQAIAQAKALAAEAHEHGGVLGNKFIGATTGPDTMIFSGRPGELILNAEQQKTLYDIANGGSRSNLAAALAMALTNMPAPVLVYSEYKRFTDRVAVIDEAAKLK